MQLSNFKSFKQDINEVLITFGNKAYPKFGNIVILAGGAGCYPKGTEYFNGTSWVPIEDYDGGKILQYNPTDGKATLTKPTDYIVLPTDQFYRIKNRRVDFVTSETHKHILINEKTNKKEVLTTKDIYAKHNTLSRGNKAKLITSFDYSGDGIDLDDNEIKLRIAVIADGHILPVKKGHKVRMSFNKDRKIEYFKELLINSKKDYKEYKEIINGVEFTRFEFYHTTNEKEFQDYWYNASKKQLKLITEEILKWDGSISNRAGRKEAERFSSNSKKSIDFVQFAFHSIGKTATLSVDNRVDKNINYSLVINHSDGLGISKNDRAVSTTKIEKVKASDEMYCFTVDSGFFVVRQKGRVYVSGNSGKGYVQDKLMGIEGKALDVDFLKKMALKAPELQKKVKEKFGKDLSEFNLKRPQDVKDLHEIIKKMGLSDAEKENLYTSILAGNPERKPNLIFDVTLDSFSKFEEITKKADELGYKKENIHIVWVVNDIKVAMEQNRGRDRIVPEDILISTHKGASLTMDKILSQSKKITKYMNGVIVLAFNKKGEDSVVRKSKLPNIADLQKKLKKAEDKGDFDAMHSIEKEIEDFKAEYGNKGIRQGSGGFYVVEANYVVVKEKGKPIDEKKLGRKLLVKIKDYTPNEKDFPTPKKESHEADVTDVIVEKNSLEAIRELTDELSQLGKILTTEYKKQRENLKHNVEDVEKKMLVLTKKLQKELS